MDEDYIERQTFSIDSSWSRKSESKKQNWYNDALSDREQDLRNAREQLQMLRGFDSDSNTVVGSLLALAYQLNEAAAHRAMMQEEEVPESIEKIREEFDDALTLESGTQLSPHKVQKLSEQASKQHQAPAYLRRLMDQNGTKIRSLIGLAYAGTEVMTPGSSDEESISLEGE